MCFMSSVKLSPVASSLLRKAFLRKMLTGSKRAALGSQVRGLGCGVGIGDGLESLWFLHSHLSDNQKDAPDSCPSSLPPWGPSSTAHCVDSAEA